MPLAMLQKTHNSSISTAIAWITCCSQRLLLQWGLKFTEEDENKGRKLLQHSCPRKKPAGKWETQCLSQTLQFPIDFPQPSASCQPTFAWVMMDPCKWCRNKIFLYTRSVSAQIADLRNGLLQREKPHNMTTEYQQPLEYQPQHLGGHRDQISCAFSCEGDSEQMGKDCQEISVS